MKELAVIVEGDTEKRFVEDILAPHLRGVGVQVWARLSGTVGRRGGVRSWQYVRDEIRVTLLNRRGRVCAIMFDFYGLRTDWPGRAESPPQVSERGASVERALRRDFAEYVGNECPPDLFLPYIQLHEFEALLFSDVQILSRELSNFQRSNSEMLSEEIAAILNESQQQPEWIDDGRETAPSKRLKQICAGYDKNLLGNIIAAEIGLMTMRAACPGLNRWLNGIEAWAGSPPAETA